MKKEKFLKWVKQLSNEPIRVSYGSYRDPYCMFKMLNYKQIQCKVHYKQERKFWNRIKNEIKE